MADREISMQSSKISLRSPLGLDSLKRLAHKLDIQCHCTECDWKHIIEITDLQCKYLDELTDSMYCPNCDNESLSISVVAKNCS